MRKQIDHILKPEIGAELWTKLWWDHWHDTQMPLPSKGLLAGGAVASMILSKAWGGEFPINDLDVFSAVSDETYPLSTPVRITEIALDEDAEADGYQGWHKVRKSGYQVIRSERRKILNNVSVRMLGDKLPTSTAYRLILQGFDLNCCQIGIDLENSRLLWTPAFNEFLANGQLKVTHLATPFHTAIRLAKKQGELNCYCDMKTELSLLASYVDMVSSLGIGNWKNRMFSRFFGRKYYDIYLSRIKALQPYCQVYRGTNQLLLPGLGIPEPNYFSMELNAPSVYRELLPHFLKTRLHLNSVSLVEMFDKLCRPTTNTTTRRRFAAAMNTGTLTAICAVQNRGFLDCNHHPKSLQKLEKFADKHLRVTNLFNRIGLNVTEQLQAIRTIWRSVNKHGLFVIGLLEDGNNVLLREATEFSEELVDRIVSDYRRSAFATQLVAPVDLSGFPRKHQVLELTNAQQLVEEGGKQRHCVGGYADAVRSGDCRIFHLEYLGVSTTLQISQNGECAEHRARFNELPPPEHVALAAELSAYIRKLNSGEEDDYMRGLLDSIPYHGNDFDDIANQIEAREGTLT